MAFSISISDLVMCGKGILTTAASGGRECRDHFGNSEMEAKRYTLIAMNLKPSHAEAAGHSATAPRSQTHSEGFWCSWVMEIYMA